MRTSAHPYCQFNYSFFQRTIPGKGDELTTCKIAILNQMYTKTFKDEFQTRFKLHREFGVTDIQQIFVPLIKCLADFQKEHIYHGNITMDNLVKEDDDDPFCFCDWGEAKKLMLMMYPTEVMD